MFNLFALLLDNPLKPATPLANGAIDETLQQFASLSDIVLPDAENRMIVSSLV